MHRYIFFFFAHSITRAAYVYFPLIQLCALDLSMWCHISCNKMIKHEEILFERYDRSVFSCLGGRWWFGEKKKRGTGTVTIFAYLGHWSLLEMSNILNWVKVFVLCSFFNSHVPIFLCEKAWPYRQMNVHRSHNRLYFECDEIYRC